MEDQVSLVRYFADVSKLVTICYKLSLEKQALLKQTKCHSESQPQNQQKVPVDIESPKQFLNKSDCNIQLQQEIKNPDKDQKKQNVCQTRSGKYLFKQQIRNKSNKAKKVSQDNNIFNCQQCDKKYYHLKSLKRHIKGNHQIIKLINQIEE